MDNLRKVQDLFSREHEIAIRIIEAYDRFHNDYKKELVRIINSHRDKQSKVERIEALMKRRTFDLIYLQGLEIRETVQIREENGKRIIHRK